MSRSDAALRAIEAAYTFEEDDARWLDGIVDALAPTLAGDPWAFVCRQGHITGVRLTPEDQNNIDAQAKLPPALLAAIRTPNPPIDHNLRRAEQVAREFGTTLRALVAHTGPVASLTGLHGTDATGDGVIVGVRGRARIAPRTRPVLEAVAAHLSAAYRLREQLLEGVARRSLDSAEAVCSPEGKLLHATPSAQRARESLAVAVRKGDLARGKLRRVAPEDAVALWTALVEGEWSLVDHVERDGKRLILARKNAPPTTIARLGKQEARVATYAALGHSDKYIAYELGLSRSTVSSHLRTALAKLHLSSRSELVRVFGPLARLRMQP